MIKKFFVFVLMVVLSAFFSITILLGIGYMSPEQLVIMFAPRDSIARNLVPEDIDFRAEQLENASEKTTEQTVGE